MCTHAVENVPSKLQCGTSHCKENLGIAVQFAFQLGKQLNAVNFAIYVVNI